MKILCIGDVCGSIGCRALMRFLPHFKKQNNIDAVIVNGENSADGNGVTPASAESIFAAGADVITGGNHSLRNKQIYEYLDSNEFIIRPANIENAPGKGIAYIDLGRLTTAVINVIGVVYLESRENPFTAADRMIEEAKQNGAKIVIIDIHAEATAEKKALGYYLDGRVAAVFGTHTHIQTADLQILPKGTGYITDIGMTGPEHSVLGVRPELSIAKIKDGAPVKFLLAEGECIINGCIFDIDDKNGLTKTVSAVEWRTK